MAGPATTPSRAAEAPTACTAATATTALQGDNSNDLMSGGLGDDTQIGGSGSDTIYGNRGVDESFGGSGNDKLWALAGADVALPGVDTLHGEDGNDTFYTRDGEPDIIDCGTGTKDNALLDRVDVIIDATPANPKGSCETVKRAAPKAKAGRAGEQPRVAGGRPQRGLIAVRRLRSLLQALRRRPNVGATASSRRQIANSVSSPLNSRSSRRCSA